ncbi:uncharacterized protein P884DRAFT_271908 [Thermothelomyces heterothallicus CBS 202.75]|uniref:uncharacterized protein n=1 Tax=Thermothelomyces heterothallicus CBS 202.75 TaxID=1149848 RepID=UPI00374281D7
MSRMDVASLLESPAQQLSSASVPAAAAVIEEYLAYEYLSPDQWKKKQVLAAMDLEKVLTASRKFTEDAYNAMDDHDRDAYKRLMKTRLAYEYPSLSLDEKYIMLAICCTEAVNRAIRRQAELIDELPGVLDTWLLQVTRRKIDPESATLVFSALTALENLTNQITDEYTTELSYFQDFLDLVEFRFVILMIAREETLGYVHPDFRRSPEVSEKDLVQLKEYWTRRLLKKEAYKDLQRLLEGLQG